MRKLGRKKSNRNHLIRNLAASLILYETIDTTKPKAKETKAYTEKLIARSKSADLPAVRRASAALFDKNAAKKLIKELLPRYQARTSGFIKSFHLNNRAGDNAPMMRLELVDKKVFVSEGPKKEIGETEEKVTTKTKKLASKKPAKEE